MRTLHQGRNWNRASLGAEQMASSLFRPNQPNQDRLPLADCGARCSALIEYGHQLF